MTCMCQSCGKQYMVDFIVCDEIWERIKPKDKPKGGGLLCGECIAKRLNLLVNTTVLKSFICHRLAYNLNKIF